MNYRKRIRVLPGITLNLSKKGISTTIGVKGLSVNFSERGTYLNTGIPGTGLYNRTRIDGRNKFQNNDELDTTKYEVVETNNPDYTSKEMSGLKEQILDTWVERKKLEEKISDEKVGYGTCIIIFIIAAICSYFFTKKYLDYSSIPNLIYMICPIVLGVFFLFLSIFTKTKIKKNKDLLLNVVLNIDLQIDAENSKEYNNFLNSYEDLKSSERIYHITNFEAINSIQQRTSAAFTIERQRVNIYDSDFTNFIITPFEPAILCTSDDKKIFLYPGFILILDQKAFYLKDSIQVCSWKDIQIEGITSPFLEEESVPSDSQVVGQSWKYVNKNGSPDRRYSNNYQIPIVNYYEFVIAVKNGLSFAFQVSNVENGKNFFDSLKRIKNNIDNLGETENNNNSETSNEAPLITINERIATRIKEFFVEAEKKLSELKTNIKQNDEWEKQYSDFTGMYGLSINDISIVDLMKYDLITTSILCRYGTLQENNKKGYNIFKLISLYFPAINMQIITNNINKFIHNNNEINIVPNALKLIGTMVEWAQKNNPKEDWLLVTGYSSIVFEYIDIIELFYHIVFSFGIVAPQKEEKNNLNAFSSQIRDLIKNDLIKAVNS